VKGLLVKQPWIDKILSGKKTWELRGSSTKNIGAIALIESGTGFVVGTCEVVDVEGPLSMATLRRNMGRHGVPQRQLGRRLPYKRTHAWVLRGARRLREPVPYKHPQGAVIWVNLPPGVATRVQRNRG